MKHGDDTDDGNTLPSQAAPGMLGRGSRLGGHFIIEEVAGRGGMGFVYRALDSRTGRHVALKLLHGLSSPQIAYRFQREAFLLSELHHPAIVSYIEHGLTEAQQPFLVMEWLEGEDLAQRLAREPLEVARTLTLLRRAAEGLSTAHRGGIVHRDLKPSNLFLRAGRPEDVVLLDFGLARYTDPTLVAVTGHNAVVGTPGYMAPEQASSQPRITASADIFSLGCVLYECLTGQAPFAAPHFAAVLAKILMAEPPRLQSLRPHLPQGLQVLVDRMLHKDPLRRIADAPQLLEVLDALASVPLLLSPPAGPPTPRPVPASLSLDDAEQQRLVSILLVPLHPLETGEQEGDRVRRSTLRDALRAALAPYGGRVELLVDGSLVATLVPERGTATDQAALAARCALTFKERWPETEVVLVTGLGVLNAHLPVGEAMDRAGQLLRELERQHASEALIVMDEVTAGLLGPAFLMSRSTAGAYLLHGEQLGADESRPLLGKPTPCVGRAQDLALLDFTFTSCVEESSARAVLVTARPGTGKSRLRHEFLRRIERKQPPPLVLLGRGDSMSVGATATLMSQVLRQLCGIGAASHLEVRRRQLYQRVARHLSAAEAQETSEFLGELCAIPFPEEDSPRLRAARQDPRLMSAQMGKALVTFLRAECAQAPVLLVLEDLHWSDSLTVKLVDEALRDLSEQPFMVLALARPEVKELFPGLWARRVQEVPLNGLNPKAATQLVREVLGARTTESTVRRVVEQSDGNALFLEELIRMEAEGRGEQPPETVRAVLQARLMRLVPGARLALLAASVFGRTFWRGGLEHVLGGQGGGAPLEQHLRQLVEQEIIEPRPEGRFAAEAEFRFHHALMVDAAYGLVPESQRPVAHQLAGAWLERLGESDAQVLAQHAQRGQLLKLAAALHARAAEQFFARDDQQGALRCVEQALACGVQGEALTRLRAIQAVVAVWMEQVERALEVGTPVLHELQAGSRLWSWLMSGLILANAVGGHREEAARLSALLLRTAPVPEALNAYVETLTHLCSVSFWSGSRQAALTVLERIREVGTGTMDRDSHARGLMRMIQGQILGFLDDQPWQALATTTLGMQDFRECGAERSVNMMQILSGEFRTQLGDHAGAVEELKQALATAVNTERQLAVAYARPILHKALIFSPEPEHWHEALALTRSWTDSPHAPPFHRGLEYAINARVLVAHGEHAEAEPLARAACEILAPFVFFRIFARTVLSGVLLALGRAGEARQVARAGVEDLEAMGGKGIYAVATYLALAEACLAQGEVGEGEQALRQAVQSVRARAADISEPLARERFLEGVPENVRALALARERWGEAG